jgi:signal transduction histidine kinase
VRTRGAEGGVEAGRAADLVFESAPLPEPDAATVAISPHHLSLIARELADNAFKFSESGTKVRVSVGRGDGMFVLSIEDSGRGMSADEIASVAAFRQFDRPSYEQQGLGIGLALARRTTELYGGTVELAGTDPRTLTYVIARIL